MANRIQAEYIEDGIILSDREAWAWFRLEPFHFPFSAPEQRIQNALTTQTLFKTFLDALPDGFEIHMLTTNTTIDTEKWEKDLIDRVDVDDNGKSEERSALEPLLKAMKTKIALHYTTNTWLGIKMGERGTRFDVKNIVGEITKAFSDVAGKALLKPDDEEIQDWRVVAKRLRSAILSNNGGQYATLNELVWLISHPLNSDASYRKDANRVSKETSLRSSALDGFKDAILVEAGAKGGSVIPTNMLEVIQEDELTG
jgi:hypothetical protein